MIVEVDTDSPVPAYEQIRLQLATMIGSGVLPAGAHLPPIRQLAADLGLAVNTVARAYHELESEGLVVSRVRHGTTVAEQAPRLSRAEVRRRVAEAAQRYVALARQLGVSPDEAQAALRVQMDAVTFPQKQPNDTGTSSGRHGSATWASGSVV